MKYMVAERFISINGEGDRAGELAVFIRFAGCNLRCGYCDTKWANEIKAAYEALTADAIYDYIRETGIKNVTLTGGEPLMQQGIEQLLALLAAVPELRVEIETNGSISLAELQKIGPRRPVFTVDYKLPSSGMEQFMQVDNFQYLQPQDTVKFVMADEIDFYRAKYILEKYCLPDKCHVHFSPVWGRLNLKLLVEWMKQNKMNDVKLQIQLHKIIWEPEARGV